MSVVWEEKRLLPILFCRLRVVSTASIVFLKLSNSTTPSQHWICHLRSIQHPPYHAEPHLKGASQGVLIYYFIAQDCNARSNLPLLHQYDYYNACVLTH